MKDIIICPSPEGPFGIILDSSSSTTDGLTGDVDRLDGQVVQISISHEQDHAVATAIVPFDNVNATNDT
jgi:phosphopantetheinyl transferase (holo-ACP synthase)